MVETLSIWIERRSKLVRKARIGTYLWSKGQPSGSFRKALRSSLATTKFIFLPFFCPVDLFFWSFFCSCQSLSFLSFGDHHFPSSCFGHRLRPCTKLETHLPHISTHPPAPPLCVLRLASPPQNPSLHPAHSFFWFPLGTGTGALTAVVGPFAQCLLLQVPPHVHYTPELQLFWHFSPFLFVSRQVDACLPPPFFGSTQQKTKTRCDMNPSCPGLTAPL